MDHNVHVSDPSYLMIDFINYELYREYFLKKVMKESDREEVSRSGKRISIIDWKYKSRSDA